MLASKLASNIPKDSMRKFAFAFTIPFEKDLKKTHPEQIEQISYEIFHKIHI